MGEFGWGEYPDMRTMAASLEAACSTIAELVIKVQALEEKVDNLNLIKSMQVGSFAPRNRRNISD